MLKWEGLERGVLKWEGLERGVLKWEGCERGVLKWEGLQWALICPSLVTYLTCAHPSRGCIQCVYWCVCTQTI